MNSVLAPISKFLSGSAALILLLLCCPDAGIAQAGGGAAQSKAVPALDDFVQIPVPRGNFKGWCGRKDRFLIGVEGQLEAYESNSKVVIPTMIPFARGLQCDEDGRHLAYVGTEIGRAVKVKIESGTSEILAEFAPQPNVLAKRSRLYDEVISISPNLRMIAADGEVTPAQNVTVIRLPSPDLVEYVRWSADSSKLFYTLRGRGAGSVEIIDNNQKKLGSGLLPNKSNFRDGWFAPDGQSVLLYLGSDIDAAPGFLWQCRIADWKCNRLKSNIQKISIGGRGTRGTISPYPVKSHPSDYEDGTIPLHPKYLVEVLDSNSKLLARQVVLTMGPGGHRSYALVVSPAGTKVALTWEVKKHRDCVAPIWDAPCIEAKIFDLSRGVR
ncbi:hypothetical protein ES707_00040 [subsurface metagenome]|jgi:hypothetical protein